MFRRSANAANLDRRKLLFCGSHLDLDSSVTRTRCGVRALLSLATAFPGLDHVSGELSLRILLPQSLFGPKFQTNAGRIRAFATFKAGLINFTTTNAGAQAGFNGALGSITSGNTGRAS